MVSTAYEEAIHNDDNTKVAHMTPDVLTQLEALTNTVAQQLAPFMLIIIAGMVGMSFFVIRFGYRLMASFERNSTEDDKRIDTFGGLFARQIEINERLASDTTARNQVQLQQADTLNKMLIEIKALRSDVRAWPEVAAVEILKLQEQVNDLQKTIDLLVVAADNQQLEVQKIQAALIDLRTGIDALLAQIKKDGNGAAAGAVDVAAA